MSGDSYTRVIILYVALAFFVVPHLIDDFLFGIPAEFGLSLQLTQFLAGILLLFTWGFCFSWHAARRRVSTARWAWESSWPWREY